MSYLLIALAFLSPECALKQAVVEKLNPPALALGLEQSFSLFAPEVRLGNAYPLAAVTLSDGTVRLYEYPRLDQLSFFSAIRHEKLRKVFVDNLMGNSSMWRPVSAFTGCALSSSDGRPLRVSLGVEDSPISPVSQMVLRRDIWSLPARHYNLCVYRMGADGF